ncbi:LuxR family transcriptional regulator, partial [bacterium]|nr:LuxR family transcriptional regulator [bacterium]
VESNGQVAADHIYYQKQIYSRVRIRKNGTITTLLVSEQGDEIDLNQLLASGDLSARELEIARLVGKNYTNSEIMSDLVISESTLKTHLNNIYRKLPLFKQFRDRLR